MRNELQNCFGNYPMMIGGVPKCFGMRENYPIVIGEVPKVFRNKREISNEDQRATKVVLEQEEIK